MLFILTIILLGLTAAGFRIGRRRALAMAGGLPKNLSALPRYYGWYVALWGFLPAVAVVALWLAFQPTLVETLVIAGLPDDLRSLPSSETGLIYNDIRNA
ncbi:MAG: phosphate ABC transporter permease family protein, partial [Alphaproteobacteria bacterium]|nr:phosphate ABC transporter permease family protein [Alphaproteobacteria bacterium]